MATKPKNTSEHVHEHSGIWWVRGVGIWFFTALACLTFAGYVAVRWVEKQILNTDNWVALVGPLPRQPAVSDALGRRIGEQVFNEQAVQSRIAGALPPQAGFLAGPLTSQLGTLTVKASQRVVAGDAFQTIWEGANRVAMGRLLANARGQTPPLQAKINQKFNINVSDMKGSLTTVLGKAGQAIPALEPASKKALSISADLKARPRRVEQAVKTTDTLAAVLPFAIAATFLIGLALARRRRLMVMSTALGIVMALLVELVLLKWLKNYTLAQVSDAANVPAVSYIFDMLTHGLRNVIYVAMGLMAGILAIGWAAGPSRWARRLRAFIALDRIKGSRIGHGWQVARSWLHQWKLTIGLAVLLAMLLGLALVVHVSGVVLINALLLTIGIWAVVWIIATPPDWRFTASA